MSIDIGSVLNDTNTTYKGNSPNIFEIMFVKSDGDFRTIRGMRWVKDSQKSADYQKAVSSSNSNRVNYNAKNLILIKDLGDNGQKSIKISRIVMYNGQRVNH